MKRNGTIMPDRIFTVPEHSAIHPQKIGYFRSVKEAEIYAKEMGGSFIMFTAPVRVDGRRYRAAVQFNM